MRVLLLLEIKRINCTVAKETQSLGTESVREHKIKPVQYLAQISGFAYESTIVHRQWFTIE